MIRFVPKAKLDNFSQTSALSLTSNIVVASCFQFFVWDLSSLTIISKGEVNISNRSPDWTIIKSSDYSRKNFKKYF